LENTSIDKNNDKNYMPITISNHINLSSSSASVENNSYNSVMIFNVPVIKKEKNIS